MLCLSVDFAVVVHSAKRRLTLSGKQGEGKGDGKPDFAVGLPPVILEVL
ncbi:hypothetical protein AcetOrient_orf02528 [Acetobacter orientalis]|uniref:Uncharacterized protein n=1 Tax=Acetobacter orientalis TaxID=146474 RepID=A0A2Z5ZI17_9PROT|nr:hypothetical protein AcetOrient_orf02528 [Acetobacter orientalis]